MRRGFTLLETVLAALIGSMVVLSGYAVFASLNAADATLSRRADEQLEMARLQRTMQRAFSSLLLAPSSSTNEAASGQGRMVGDTDPDAVAADDGLLARFILGPETDQRIARLTQRAKFAAGGGGGRVAAPQRLELVLNRPPIVAPPAERLTGLALIEASQAVYTDAAGGVRGAFVLTPDEVSRVSRTSDDRTGWTLWWHPIVGAEDDGPVPIATGLAFCRWQIFKGREMHDELTATSPSGLPAYVQLEVETLGGLYANYLFELAWTVGAEPGTVEDDSLPDNEGGDGTATPGSGGQQGPGAGGQLGGPGRPGARPPARPGTRPERQLSPSRGTAQPAPSPRPQPIERREEPR